MSDPLPPQPPALPPLPPPPPLPPAPDGYAPRPIIGWGVGDIFWGLLVVLLGNVLVAVVLFAGGAIDPTDVAANGSVGELSLWAIAVSLAGAWLGFIGWPAVITYRKGQRSLAKDFGLEIRWIDLAWGLLGGFAAVAAAALAGVAWKIVTGDDAPSNGDFLPKDPGLVAGIVLWLLIAVGTPIAEELFFRGLTLRAVGRRWGLRYGVLASGLIFGLMHASGASSLSGAVFIVGVTAAYGLVFALLVVRAQGRLGPSIVSHSIVNTIALLALFLT